MSSIEERVAALERRPGCLYMIWLALMALVVAIWVPIIIWHDPLEVLRLALKAWLLR